MPVIQDLCNFLDHQLSMQDIQTLDTWMKIDNGRTRYVASAESDHEREFRGRFIRKGTVGDWRNYFSQELSKKFDQWIAEENNNLNIPFQFE